MSLFDMPFDICVELFHYFLHVLLVNELFRLGSGLWLGATVLLFEFYLLFFSLGQISDNRLLVLAKLLRLFVLIQLPFSILAVKQLSARAVKLHQILYYSSYIIRIDIFWLSNLIFLTSLNMFIQLLLIWPCQHRRKYLPIVIFYVLEMEVLDHLISFGVGGFYLRKFKSLLDVEV